MHDIARNYFSTGSQRRLVLPHISKWRLTLPQFTMAGPGGGSSDVQWYFSQVKGAMDDDVAEADIISTIESSYSGELLAGEEGVRVNISQQQPEVHLFIGQGENVEPKGVDLLCVRYFRTLKGLLRFVLFSYTVVFGALLLVGWTTYFMARK